MHSLVPPVLEIGFIIPDDLALRMASYQSQVTLHDSHGLSIGIAAYGSVLGGITGVGATIIEEHVMFLAQPVNLRRGAERSFDISSGTFDILHSVYAMVQQIEIVPACPVSTHAYSQVFATVGNEIDDPIHIAAPEELVIEVSVADTSGECHDVLPSKYLVQVILDSEYGYIEVGFQRSDHAVATLAATCRVVLE